MDRIGEAGDQTSEGQTTGVYLTGFTEGSLAGKGARVCSDKELMYIYIYTYTHNYLSYIISIIHLCKGHFEAFLL